MHFSGVDIPLELLEAHQQGTLVLFVGAGASMGPPTSLPSFTELAATVATELGSDVGDDMGNEDLLLGRLDDNPHQDVHAIVRRHILKATQGNALHTALAKLAGAGGTLRIVTTNYDRFLSHALGETGAAFEEFRSPALPMGDDFDGLVYLHGSVDQDPRKLVITDKDFGRAYLSDAWAARFLERMFSEYVVCFVGYSHRDVVLSYMARGLRPGSKRYAFTSEGLAATSRWSRLGITPIHYDDEDNSHSQLLASLENWGSWAASGLIDRHQLTSRLASTTPSGIPDEDDFLERALEDAVLARAFSGKARGREWLDWISTRDVFQALTDKSIGQPSPSHQVIADWFAENFVVSDAEALYALSFLRRQSKQPNPVLWHSVCHALLAVKETRDWMTPWILWLVDNLSLDREPEIEDLSWLLAEGEAVTTVGSLLILEEVLKPRPRASHGLLGDRIEYVVETSHIWLEEITHKLLKGISEPRTAVAILRILEGITQRIYTRNLLASGSSFDTWTYSRRAIEESPTLSIDEGADFVIDLARECVDSLARVAHPAAEDLFQKWVNDEVPLLRRLAVYGWLRRPDKSGTEKLEWLLERQDRGLLFETNIRHESLLLIRSALPEASESTRARLLDVVLLGPESPHSERDYETFRLLTWITQADPKFMPARAALDALKEKHPEFEEALDPDTGPDTAELEWSTAEDEAPWPEEFLHNLLIKDPKTAVREIRRYQAEKDSFRGPSWWGARQRVTGLVSRWPLDGFALWEHALDDPEVLKAVIDGWAGSSADSSLAERILDAVAGLELSEYAPTIATLLSPRASNQSPGPSWFELPQARRLALALWPHIKHSKALDGDPLFTALNSPDGKLAEFWMEAIGHDWRQSKDEWDGLSGQPREALEMMCKPDLLPYSSAWPILVRHLRFLYSADAEWTTMHILPLLTWGLSLLAANFWSVLLQAGGINQALLEAGLKEGLLTTVSRSAELSESARLRLANLLASVAIQSLWSGRTRLQWLLELTHSSSPESCAAWISSIRRQLEGTANEVVSQCWDDWMRLYLKARTEGRPRSAPPEEASALAGWVDVLSAPENIKKAVDLICLMPAGLSTPTLRLRKMDENRLRSAPNAFARLLAHLMQNSTPPQYLSSDLERVYLVLANESEVDGVHLRAIRENALRLGIYSAPQWPIPES